VVALIIRLRRFASSHDVSAAPDSSPSSYRTFESERHQRDNRLPGRIREYISGKHEAELIVAAAGSSGLSRHELRTADGLTRPPAELFHRHNVLRINDLRYDPCVFSARFSNFCHRKRG
jgi:hypothetical protein